MSGGQVNWQQHHAIPPSPPASLPLTASRPPPPRSCPQLEAVNRAKADLEDKVAWHEVVGKDAQQLIAAAKQREREARREAATELAAATERERRATQAAAAAMQGKLEARREAEACRRASRCAVVGSMLVVVAAIAFCCRGSELHVVASADGGIATTSASAGGGTLHELASARGITIAAATSTASASLGMGGPGRLGGRVGGQRLLASTLHTLVHRPTACRPALPRAPASLPAGSLHLPRGCRG